ncbi:MAG: tRNA nucleotidyltransferase [Gracilibacter sp. BRH_c7a]|nr:MAG: tRNA nucleotidyltransferase [Gracilibacter sp. BRH_c7a]
MNDFQQKVIDSMANHASVWIVGGAVRDRLLGVEAKDVDLATLLPLEKTESILCEAGLFPKTIGIKFGTLSLFQGDDRIDIVSIESIESDAVARDFTINAIYQDPVTKNIVDPLSGYQDLMNRILKTCGFASKRYKEDPVRIMRMVKFAVKYDMTIEKDTWEKAQELLPLLERSSRERITAELAEILILENAEKAVTMLYELGYWGMFVPELARLKGIIQNQYHSLDVWEHTLAVFRNTPPDLFMRLAGLFHDIGKWEVASRECYVRGELRLEGKEYMLDNYKLISTRSGKELDYKIKSFLGKDLIVLGARLDHYPETVQFKRVIHGEPIPQGLTYKENGKRHFLNHEQSSSILLVEILKRYSFSMFFAGAGKSREKDLLKIVENHMRGTLAFMPEFRGETSRQSLRDRAAELSWYFCWDGRTFSLQNIHDFVLLWKADFEAKKAHTEEENKTFERLYKELIMAGLWQNENLDKIDWNAFYKYALEKGLKDQQLGKFKEMVQAKAMIDMNVKLDKVFLDKAYRKNNERR